jgi:MFS family permease
MRKVEGTSGMSGFRAEMKAGWGVVAASGVGFGLGLSGLPFYTTGLFIEPVTTSFHWSLGAAQGGLTLMMLANTVTLPAFARIAERFGARRTALWSVALFGLGYMSMAFETGELWVWYLHFIALSVGGAGTLAAIWTRAISSWFVVARGAALGFAMAGTGVTAVFAPLLCEHLIATIGWRSAYLVLGTLPLVIALPLVFWLFRADPPDKGPPEAAIEHPNAAVQPWRNWRFWIIGGAFLCIGVSVSGSIPNLVKLLRTHGLTTAAAAQIASLVGVFVVIGRGGCGPLLDRVRASFVAAVIFTAAAGACLLLMAEHLSAGVLALAAALIGLAAGAEFDILPYLASRYFGVHRVGWALGLLSIFFYVGAALGPFGFGWLHDLSGSYMLPLKVAALGFAVGGAALLFLDAYPREAASASLSEIAGPST